MRRRSFLGPVLFSGGLLVLWAGGCGHSIKPDPNRSSSTSSGGGSGTEPPGTNGGSTNPSAGGTPGNSVVLEAPIPDNPAASPNPSAACPVASMPTEASRPGYSYSRSAEVTKLLSELSDDGKFKQMYGIETPPDRSGAVYRDIERSEDVTLPNGKILRGIMYRDAGRGVNLAAGQHDRPAAGSDNNFSTAFPAPSVRAASWDVDLEMEVGVAIGKETMASKNTMLLAPCMNIIRHPYWGRTQETYSEDMYHTGRMASALTAGLQKHVIACAKHYAANNIENNRFNQNAIMDEQTLREIYTRHFEMVVKDGGVASVMAAYNSVNGKKCTQNKHLLTEILRDDYGFKGFVISDWWATPGEQSAPDAQTAQANTKEAVKAGMDIEVPWDINYSQLGAALNAGDISREDIDKAVGRILDQKARFNQLYKDGPYGLGSTDIKLSGDSLVNYEQHFPLAEKAEVRSAVLLKNGNGDAPVLPLGDSKSVAKDAKSIAVIGIIHDFTLNNLISDQTELLKATGDKLNLATDANIGDRGSSRVNADPTKSVGPFDGIKAKASSHGIDRVITANSVTDDVKNSDVIVVVVGLSAAYEGEEYSLVNRLDRQSLDLPENQADLVGKALETGKTVIVIVESGSIVNLPWLNHSNQKQATFWGGYGGQRQGDAFAKLIFGEENFSGKMPLAWPKQEDLPEFRNSDGGNNTTMGYFFGYRYYDDVGKSDKLVFPFGHGLSYTTFKYENLQLKDSCGVVKESTEAVYFSVDVTNTGDRAGDEIAMLFVEGPKPGGDVKGKRAVKELKRFHRASFKAGEGKRIVLPLRIQDLRHWEGDASGKWIIDKGEYKVKVGPNAGNLSQSVTFTIE